MMALPNNQQFTYCAVTSAFNMCMHEDESQFLEIKGVKSCEPNLHIILVQQKSSVYMYAIYIVTINHFGRRHANLQISLDFYLNLYFQASCSSVCSLFSGRTSTLSTA